jgi:hypothetical protein
LQAKGKKTIYLSSYGMAAKTAWQGVRNGQRWMRLLMVESALKIKDF